MVHPLGIRRAGLMYQVQQGCVENCEDLLVVRPKGSKRCVHKSLSSNIDLQLHRAIGVQTADSTKVEELQPPKQSQRRQ